jgi:hypothetical protein
MKIWKNELNLGEILTPKVLPICTCPKVHFLGRLSTKNTPLFAPNLASKVHIYPDLVPIWSKLASLGHL